MELVYGLHAVDALLRQQPGQVTNLWVQDGRNDKRIAAVLELAKNQGVSAIRESREQLDARVEGRHQGVVAQVQREPQQWDEHSLQQLLEQLTHPALLLVLDGVTDPHNLGACLRSADAAGVDAVIVPKDNAADLTPVVRKVACGAAEVVPFIRVTNLARTLESLKERGIWLYGAAGEAENTIYNSDLTGPVAIVISAEGDGLRRLTRETCDHLVSIPMAGRTESLNASVAAGIALYAVAALRSS